MTPDLTAMSALPRYLRIAEAVTIEIGIGRLAQGDRLPPEREMAVRYGVTVTTLRKSLKLLQDRGLIERRQGSGNYITGQRDKSGTYALFRLERHPEGGGLPSADLIALRHATIDPAMPRLHSAPREAWNIRRLRRLDDRPLAVEDIWLDAPNDPPLTSGLLSESLYKTYRERLDLHIVRVEDQITVAPRPDWAPNTLSPPPGMQMGLVERRAFDGYERVVEVSRTWFDPGAARYVARHP